MSRMDLAFQQAIEFAARLVFVSICAKFETKASDRAIARDHSWAILSIAEEKSETARPEVG
jgi:hypothetical protein